MTGSEVVFPQLTVSLGWATLDALYLFLILCIARMGWWMLRTFWNGI